MQFSNAELGGKDEEQQQGNDPSEGNDPSGGKPQEGGDGQGGGIPLPVRRWNSWYQSGLFYFSY